MSISAGGYVRSVAHELGQDLGCGAHLSSLRRTQAGVFTLTEAHTLEELEALAGNAEALEALCVHPRSLLPEMPAVTGDAMALGRLRNGAQANLPEFSQAALVKVLRGSASWWGLRSALRERCFSRLWCWGKKSMVLGIRELRIGGYFLQQRLQRGQQRVGDDLGAFGGGVDAVALDGVGNVDQIFVDHGHEGRMMLGSEVAENLIEGVDVVGAVVGRQRDAGEQHLDVGIFKRGEHRVEVAAGLVEGQAAQAVVAAEFDDDDGGMQQQERSAGLSTASLVVAPLVPCLMTL